MTKADAQNEVANIECHIKALLPADYLASIGADERGYTHERHLNLRVMRIFDDLANRLAALSSAPPDLVALAVDAGEELAMITMLKERGVSTSLSNTTLDRVLAILRRVAALAPRETAPGGGR